MPEILHFISSDSILDWNPVIEQREIQQKQGSKFEPCCIFTLQGMVMSYSQEPCKGRASVWGPPASQLSLGVQRLASGGGALASLYCCQYHEWPESRQGFIFPQVRFLWPSGRWCKPYSTCWTGIYPIRSGLYVSYCAAITFLKRQQERKILYCCPISTWVKCWALHQPLIRKECTAKGAVGLVEVVVWNASAGLTLNWEKRNSSKPSRP